MPEIPDRDLPGALRDVAVAKGIDVDKTARSGASRRRSLGHHRAADRGGGGWGFR